MSRTHQRTQQQKAAPGSERDTDTRERPEARSTGIRRPPPIPIAVTGIGCRFAGVHGPRAFWAALREGRDLVSDVPPERFDTSSYTHRTFLDGEPLLASEAGGFLEDIDCFDAAFFRISPHEAPRLDPHQRIFLETAWEAIEDAGLVLDGLRGSRTGVYTSQLNVHYWEELHQTGVWDLHALTGAEGPGTLAGRLAHILDLRGTTVSVDATCAASLAATHLACQALRLREIDAAIVGGVNLLEQPTDSIALGSGSLIAASGRCRFGDEAADGFVRSEGAVVIVLKPLEHALADRDRIYAVIRGSAATNDGASGGQFFSPSVTGRGEALRRAYEAAGVDPRDVDYVEAHGAGTPTGDLTELAAMDEVLGRPRRNRRRVLIGSVKSNLGHTETVSGLAGLIKTALSLHYGQIPATLHVRKPTPEFDWNAAGLRLARRRTAWPKSDHPPTAGVSGFGISGSNVHVVLTAAPDSPAGSVPRARGRRPTARLLPISARCPDALAELAGAHARRVQAAGTDAELADVCYSAAVRRTHHAFRTAAVATDPESTAEALLALQRISAHPPRAFDRPRIVFVFPGLGAQWTGMARELRAQCAPFAAALERYDAAIRAEAGWSVITLLHSDDPLTDVGLAQPAVWAVECALAEVWSSWGVRADLVIGHSMGEIAAAAFSGALSLADAAAVICRRSAIMRKAAGRGAMIVVQLSGADAQAVSERHGGRVSVAVRNGPSSTVLAGDPAVLESVERELDERGIFCRRVRADVAAHCAGMDPLLDELRALLPDVRAAHGRLPVISTVHGRTTSGADFGREYWVENLREPVRFADAVRTSLEQEPRPVLFVELTPHPLLAHAIQESIDESGAPAAVISSLRHGAAGLAGLLEALGQAYCRGADPDWEAVADCGVFTALPMYPWQRRRFRAADAVPNVPADLVPMRGRGALQGADAATPRTAIRRPRASTAVGHAEAPHPAVPAHEQADARHALRTAIAEVLALNPAEVELSMPVTAYGLDSVMALDLSRRVLKSYGLIVPIRLLLQGGTLDDAAAAVLRAAAA